jgi:small-conductance mechanosensitive channel
MISPTRIDNIVQLEPLLVLAGLVFAAGIFYKVFLRRLSEDRHRLLGRLFKNLSGHGLAVAVLFALYHFSYSLVDEDLSVIGDIAVRVYPYIGFLVIVWASVFFVKLARIIAFEYLFLISMKVGVPVLLVNILSLGLSLCLGGWIATEVFAVRLAPVLATSAMISVILGLAMQDTLGNLFAGIALQMDKPYEIGDWVEIQNPGNDEKWLGRIDEITWRSTFLKGFLDEHITIPNRLIAQSQISAYGAYGKPFFKRLDYHIPLDSPIDHAKAVALKAAKLVAEKRNLPEPAIYFNEVGESWINLRMLLGLRDFGSQIRMLDEVNSAVFEAFAREGLQIAVPTRKIDLHQSSQS